MKASTGVLIGVSVGALITGAGAYWLGVCGLPQGAAQTATGIAEQGAGKGRQLLYYRNPMGLPDTSPVPKKDPMGMDYIPVYADEESGEPASASRIRISTEKVQKLGVRVELAERRVLERVVRAVGRVEPDERRLYAIAPKFEGYVENLHVNVTGQPVGKGQPLFDVYSPELNSAQREYAIAAQGVKALQDAGEEARAGMRQLAEASLLRLQNWDISREQVESLARSGAEKRTLTFRSPVVGIVTEKKAVQGMRFMPGEMLYQVADLSSVWVIADVFEQDIGLVDAKALAKVRINAYPGRLFEGRVSYVYPTMNAATRTIPVRIELANPGLLLKPAMFAQVELPATARKASVTVPIAAVIDSGTRQLVFVQSAEGRFEPREVKLGARDDHRVAVQEGVREGEPVVVAANFLIDAESNLKAALGGFGTPEAQARTQARTGPRTASAVGHHAEGRIENIDASGTLTISHGPVATLKWPSMTMEFKAVHAALTQGFTAGDRVVFEFVERAPGEWVVTSLAASRDTPASGASAHAGH